MIKARSYKIFIFFFFCLLSVNTLKAQERETEQQRINTRFGNKAAKNIAWAIDKSAGTLFHNLLKNSLAGSSKSIWIDTDELIPVEGCDDLEKAYDFITDLEVAKESISGKKQLSNYSYWVNVAYYAKMTQQMGCLLREMDTYAKQCESLGNEPGNQIRTASLVMDFRKQAAEAWHQQLYYQKKATAIAGFRNDSWIQKQNRAVLKKITRYDQLIGAILGKPAPALKIPAL